MPRPKKIPATLRAQPVTLIPEVTQKLADCLGLPEGAARVDMINEVQALLTDHRIRAERNRTTAASKRDTLDPLLKHAHALRDGIRALEPGLRMEALGNPLATYDQLEHLCDALGLAVAQNSTRASRAAGGSPSGDEMTTLAAQLLQCVFAKFYAARADEEPSEREAREERFIYLALSAAGSAITNPHADRNRTRFTRHLLRD